MLKKLLTLCALITFAKAQKDCSKYWQYVDQSNEIQGLVTIPPENSQEHKLRVQLTIVGKISSVGKISF